MDRIRYFKYGNAGGIHKVIARELNRNSGYYNSLKELLSSVKNRGKNIKIREYGYDDRLKKTVFMIVGDHSNYKNVFICYFIEEF